MKRSGTGRGKLILFGEHAAVYGYPAIGTAISEKTVLEWLDNGESDSALPPLTPNDFGTDRDVMLSLLNDLKGTYAGQPICGGTLQRPVGVPRVGGLGSSAALCTALARLWLDREGTDYDREVHEIANHLEKQFHGTPSGIDTGMSCSSEVSLWRFESGKLPSHRTLKLPAWHLVYGALSRNGGTARSVADLSQRMKSGNPVVTESMAKLGAISEEFLLLSETSLLGGGGNSSDRKFGDEAAVLTNRAQRILSDLGLSVPDLDALLELAMKNGAQGGKLSGGGMGGAFFLCAPNRRTRDMMLKKMKEELPRAGIEPALSLRALDLGSSEGE